MTWKAQENIFVSAEIMLLWFPFLCLKSGEILGKMLYLPDSI